MSVFVARRSTLKACMDWATELWSSLVCQQRVDRRGTDLTIAIQHCACIRNAGWRLCCSLLCIKYLAQFSITVETCKSDHVDYLSIKTLSNEWLSTHILHWLALRFTLVSPNPTSPIPFCRIFLNSSIGIRRNGIWRNGTRRDGIRRSGIWQNGIRRDEIWQNGIRWNVK